MLKEFLIDNILSKVVTKKIPLKKGDCPISPSNEYNLPARTATINNQGLSCYVPKEMATVCKNMISVSANGDFCAFWHDTEFTILQDSYALEGKNYILNEKIALYIIGGMYKALADKYNWNNKSGWEKIKNERISLPIKTDEYNMPIIDNTYKYHNEGFIPDFEYMEEHIAELEEERIAELEGYLVATGLNDYELTDEDRQVLSLSGFGNYEERDSEDAVKVCKEMREFRCGDLFNSQTGDTDLQQKDINGKGTFFINSGVENNGIKGMTDRPAKIFPSNTISIDFWGNAYYRDFEYKMATHNHVFSLSGDCIKNEHVGLYIVSKMNYMKNLFSYSNMGTWTKIKELFISLPIQTDANNNPIIDTDCKYHPDGYIPDWDFMVRYIKVIEKIVIADVVKYKDEMIETTKSVIVG